MLIATQTFRPEPDEVRHARHFVTTLLAELDLPTEQAALVTSELVTNAVLHGRTEFRLEVDHDLDSVRISVFDSGGGWPCRRPAAGDGDSGRGLRLVDHMAERWGVTWNDPGKAVWAELSLPARVAVPARLPVPVPVQLAISA
jgi:anti-sigma regulatory factor (Ser/Thr protein kinase)